MSNINAVLAKMGLTEQEATLLFEHFIPHFITEHCQLNISLDSEVNWDYDNKYNSLNLKVSLDYKEQNLLESSSNCSLSLS